MFLSFFPFLRVASLQNDSNKLISSNGTVDYLPTLGDYTQTKLWSDDSYWYMRVKKKPTLHPNSDEMIDWLLTTHSDDASGGKYPNIQWNSWTHCLYDAYEDTPVYSVYEWERGHSENIPFPDPYPIQIPLEADHSVTVIDWHRGNVWHCAEIEATGGTYRVRAATAFPIGGTGLWDTGQGWSVGGSGCPKAAYMIRPEEIEAGVINHALGCAMESGGGTWNDGSRYDTENGFVHPPASHTDREVDANHANMIPEGARIQLDPAIDLDALFGANPTGTARTAKIIAKAMQDYGIVAVEAGGTWHIYAEHDFTADWNPPSMSGLILSPIAQLVTPTYNPWRVIDFELYPSIDNLFEYELPAP